MAAFGEKTFSVARYAANRPVYPQELYNVVLKYHQAPRDLLLDLGCGHGLSTGALAPHYAKAIGIDPSEHMLALARSLTATETSSTHPDSTRDNVPSNIDFRVASSDALPFLADSSVSTVVASQAAHWFPYPSTWKELVRVVRPGGTLAFWGYSDPVLLGYPYATKMLYQYAYERGGSRVAHVKLRDENDVGTVRKVGCEQEEDEQEWMGGYWSWPGRAVVENLYRDLMPTEEDGWTSVERVESLPSPDEPETTVERRKGGNKKSPEDGGFVMEKQMRVRDFKEYIRTWSAYHNWTKQHPEARKREAGDAGASQGGDVIDWMVDAICKVDKEWADEEHKVLVKWPVGILLARRK